MIKSLNFGEITTLNNLILAPLAGYSHKTMRMINRSFGAGYTVTEMVSVEGVLRDSQKTFQYADISDAPLLTSVQLFGKDSPKKFYEASKIIQKMFGAKSININFGCPAPKVLKNGAGSHLLNEPQRMVDIINAVKDSGVAVEAKIRCGFEHDNLDNIILALDTSDVDIIMMHCRLTKDKFLHGTANWDYFSRARKLTSKLLIANGDINTPEDAKKIFEEYQMDGLMIGRSAIAKPYIFQQILDYCQKGIYEHYGAKKLLQILHDYVYLWKKNTGSDNIIPLRGAMMSLLIGFEGVSKIRSQIAQSSTSNDIEKIIQNTQPWIEQ